MLELSVRAWLIGYDVSQFFFGRDNRVNFWTKSLHCMDDLTTLHPCFSCFQEIFIFLISWSNHLISSRRSIQVFYGCILLPHKRHLVVLVILCTYNSHLQIQNKCRLNKMSQVWCRKGSLWKVRFIFEITNISICAAWRVVVRLVVSIFSTLHSRSQFCPTCQVEESLSSCSSPFSPSSFSLIRVFFCRQREVLLMLLRFPAPDLHSIFLPVSSAIILIRSFVFLVFRFIFLIFLGLFSKLLVEHHNWFKTMTA